jgi:hypothetical protein
MSGLEREHRSLKKSARRLKMTVHKVEEVVPTGEEIGLKFLRQMNIAGRNDDQGPSSAVSRYSDPIFDG